MQPSTRKRDGSVGHWFVSKRFMAIGIAVVTLCVLMSSSAVAGSLKACMMPSYNQQSTYANAVINEPITGWGRAGGGTGPYSYTLDFGDGTAAAGGAVADPNYIGTAHTYASGGSKTATLTVTSGGDTRVCQTVIRVSMAATHEIRVNQAIDKGLLWIYRNQTAVNASQAKWSYYNYGMLQYDLAASGFAVLALEENGHLAAYDYEDDIYAETVQKGLNFIESNAIKTTLTAQTSGNPDSNGNNTGAYLFNNTYANGIAVSALVMSTPSAEAASNTIVSVGAYAGSSLVQLVGDLFDQFSYCQGDGSYLGGWQYSVNVAGNTSFDGSAQQWPCLDFTMGKDRWGLLPPAWVIVNAVKGFKTVQNATSGGCGYSANNYWVNSGKTGGMLVGYKLGDKGNADVDVIKGINYLGAYWCADNSYLSGNASTGWAGDFYAMYGIKKGLHLQEVETVSTSLGVRNWYNDISAWLLGNKEGGAAALAGMPYIPNAGFAPTALRALSQGFGQNTDGSWTGGGSYMPSAPVFGTPLAVLMLTKTVTLLGPQAVIAPVSPQPSLRPPLRVNPIPFVMDGSGSYHQDRSKSIVQYLWDWDSSDGLDWNNPNARGPKPTNPGYRAIGKYTVTLLVTDDSNPTLSNKTTTVVIVTDQDVAPIAITLPPGLPAYAAKIGEPITLDGSASYDPDGDTITNYTWDVNCNGIYGDAGDISSASPTATVTFASQYIGAISLQVAANGKKGNSSLSMADVYSVASDIAVETFKVNDFVLHTRADIHAVFKNEAGSVSDFNNVLVRFYNGNPLTGGLQISTNYIVNLPRGVSVTLDTRLIGLTGVEAENIYVYVDANRRIPEYNELNNVACVAPDMRRVVFHEEFETIVGTMPPGWTQERDSNNVAWVFQNGGNSSCPTNAHAGNYNAFFYKDNRKASKTKLVSPLINFGAATQDAQLTFWQCMGAWGSDQDELRVFYKTAEDGDWTLLEAFTTNVTFWTQRTISLPNVNQSYYLAFEGTAKYGHGVCIDDIAVMATGANAYAPVITSVSPLPPATVKAEYNFSLTATGGGGHYTWTAATNTPLPKGLGIVPSTGAITGTPTIVATTVFRVRVTGAESLYSEQTFSLTVNAALVISGKVSDSVTLAGVKDVIIALSSGGGTVTTDTNGNYSAAVKKGWTGTVTPIAPADVVITPSSKSYSNVIANVTAQNYTWWKQVPSIPLASYALQPENVAFKYSSSSGSWAYYFATKDLRCASPAKGGSAAMQVTVTGPGILSFTYELIGADGTNKLVCAVGARNCPACTTAGEAKVNVAVPAGVQIVKWTVTRGPASPEAVGRVCNLAWTPLAKVTAPVPANGQVLMQEDFTGLAWTGDNEYCRVYTGLASTSLTSLGTYSGGTVPAADMTALLAAAAGKTVYWRVDAVRTDSFGVEAVNTGTLWSFGALPAGSPEFKQGDTYANLTVGVRYDLGPSAFDNSLTGTVTCALKAGVMPPGMKAEIRNSSLYLTGVPTKVGSYKPVIQLSVKNGTVVKPGMSVMFDLTVAALGLAAGSFNGWIDESVRGQGTLALTVSTAGALSGKMTLGGTNYTYAATSYGGETNGYFFARLDAKLGTNVLSKVMFSVWPDGSITAVMEKEPSAKMVLFRNNWKESGMAAVLTKYLGYYTVALPVTNDATGVSPRGSGYMTVTVSSSGAVTMSGYLADGNSFSLSGTLLYEPADVAAETDARARFVFSAIPSAYGNRGGVFGVLEIVAGPDWAGATQNPIIASVPLRWWNVTAQSVAGYNPTTGVGSGGFFCKLGVSGGYYDKLMVLQTVYATRTLSLSATGAPADYEGYNNGDSGFSFASGPENLAVTPTLTGFTVPAKKLAKLPTNVNLIDFDNSTNAWGMTLVLSKSTGLINGSFTVYYEDAPVTVQKTKSLTYKGVLTPVRAIPVEAGEGDIGLEGRGFYLVPDKSYYRDSLNVLKYYSFSWSYDLLLESVLNP